MLLTINHKILWNVLVEFCLLLSVYRTESFLHSFVEVYYLDFSGFNFILIRGHLVTEKNLNLLQILESMENMYTRTVYSVIS